jgi:hypothetical protein
MEPFEVLRDMIRQRVDPRIGGPPQVVKVYRHINVTPFGVFWPDRASGAKTLLGRELQWYERVNTGIIDPDQLDIVDGRLA